MKAAILGRLVAAQQDKAPAVLLTRLADGSQCLVIKEETLGEVALTDNRDAVMSRVLVTDRGEVDDGVFVHPFNPPLRLAIIGAVHIAQALAPMAALAGYDVTIIDPRRAFATDSRFPQIALSSEWPDDGLEAFAPDSRSAIVTLTHDPKLDDPALTAALASEAFYIAALGSRRTHAGRLERLGNAGFEGADLARIHGPAGLPIKARSPAEIAIAILAQMTAALRRAAD